MVTCSLPVFNKRRAIRRDIDNPPAAACPRETVRKAERIAQDIAPKPRVRFFWWDQDETRDVAQARMRASIARGEVSPTDRCYLVSWKRPKVDGTDA